MARKSEGIEVIHSRNCRAKRTTRQSCNCQPSYRAQVWDKHLVNANGKRGVLHKSKAFASKAEAVTWRDAMRMKVKAGEARVATKLTVKQACQEFMTDAIAGGVLNRSGDRYKPSVLRKYQQSLDSVIYPKLGHVLLQDLRPWMVQKVINDLNARGLAGSSVRNTLDPLRVVCREATVGHLLPTNPCAPGLLRVPKKAGRRMRIEPPAVALKMIAAAPPPYRAFWATALFAGLRRGELRALRWHHIDLKDNVIRVEVGWDDKEGEIRPKSQSGVRKVPLPSVLRKELLKHKLATGRDGEDFVFGRTETAPFVPSTIRNETYAAWTEKGLKPISVHEARHCAASYMIAAGLDPKQVQMALGHAHIRTTFDLYGHLMPDDNKSKLSKIDAFLNVRKKGA